MIKKLQFSLLFLFWIPISTLGQTDSYTFGEVSQEEMEMEKYDKDEDAEAVVLFDIGKSEFRLNGNKFEITFERTTRIKILTEAGIDWAEVNIPLYNQGRTAEKVRKIEANAYNLEDGEIVKVPFNVKNTFDEKINENYSVTKFAIPNVKEGTIIEYKYSTISPFIFNLQDWEFQWRIPVVHSEYETAMVPFYEYNFLLQGSDKLYSYDYYRDNKSRLIYDETYQNIIHNFVLKDVPAFENESFITSINDYIIKIDFQLSKVKQLDGTSEEILTTWEELNESHITRKDFGVYAKAAERFASRIFDIKDLKSKSEEDRFNEIVSYVKENFTWDGDNRKYTTKTASNFNKDKIGNSAEINLFTIGLLNAAGIEAKPVLISTRSHGKIKVDYPYSHFFNYVIILAEIDGKTVLTDATDRYIHNNRLPIKCLNDVGLVIQKGEETKWISLESNATSRILENIEINKITPDSLNANIKLVANEYDANYYRKRFSGKTELIKEGLETDDYQIDKSSIKVDNQSDIEKPYTLTYSQTGTAEIVNDKIYLSPFLDEIFDENPLKQKERTYPIDMTYSRIRILNSIIDMPEGYKIDYLPETININNENIALVYNINSNEDKITASLQYHFKKPIYPAEMHKELQSYYDEIIKKGNDKIVFVRE